MPGLLGGQLRWLEVFCCPQCGQGNGWPALVLAGVQGVRPADFGRTRMRAIADASARSMLGFVREVVELGTTTHADG